MEVVDQHERAAGIGARVEPNRRPGPIDRPLPFDLVGQRAGAVAQADDERAARLAPGDIAGRLALILQDFLDQLGQALGALAEHAFRRTDQVVALVGGLPFRRRGRRSSRRIAGIGGRCRRLRGRRRRSVAIIDMVGRRFGGGGRAQIGVDRRVGVDRLHLRQCRCRHCDQRQPQHRPVSRPLHRTSPAHLSI